MRSYDGPTNICLRPYQGGPIVPRQMISTRPGGNWSSPTTWQAGRSPIAGDTIIIDDSSHVEFTEGTAFRVPFVQIGRGLRNRGSYLKANQNLIVERKLTTLRPQDTIETGVTVQGDFEHNSNGLLALNRSLRVYYTGNQQKRLYRNSAYPVVPQSFGQTLRCRSCTVNVEYPLISSSMLELDSGYYNPQQGHNFYFWVEPKGISRTQFGHYIGQRPAISSYAGNSAFRLRYSYKQVRPRQDTLFAENEWPLNADTVGELYGDSANIVLTPAGMQSTTYRCVMTHFRYATDSVNTQYIDEFDTDIRARYFSISPRIVRNTESGSLGQPDAFRYFRITTAQAGLNPNCRVELIRTDQVSGTIVREADVSKLLGRCMLRIDPLVAAVTRIKLSMYNNPNDSSSTAQLRRGHVICQAPTPNGPFRAVAYPDSANLSHIRDLEVDLTRGRYFALGTIERPVNINFRAMIWPNYYELICPTASNLPIGFGIQNIGTRDLDSVNLGFDVGFQRIEERIALTPPMRPYERRRVFMNQGLTLPTPGLYPAKAWVGNSQKPASARDTQLVDLDTRPKQLPFVETFDTIRWSRMAEITRYGYPIQLGAEWRNWTTQNLADYGNNYVLYTGSGSQNSIGTTRAGHENYYVTVPVDVPAGRSVVYCRVLVNGPTPPIDTIRLDYSTDCGQSWQPITKRANRLMSLVNNPTWLDTIRLSQPATIALRYRNGSNIPSNARVSTYLDEIGIAATVTDLPEHIVNSLQPTFYPNPTTNHLYSNLTKSTAVRVFNLMGQQVLAGEISSNQSLDMGGLGAGIYIVRYDGGWAKVVRE